jgi:hypothetical protein
MARGQGAAIIGAMRLVGERKALGAIVFALIAGLFMLNALLMPPDFGPMFWALVAVYGTAYFGLVAGWFWARWFASGVAISGLVIAVMMGIQVGLEPVVFIWGGGHALVYLCLLGEGPRSVFEGRMEWRQRYRMDDLAVQRLGKAVQRAGASLPYLIMAALGPRQNGMDTIALTLGVLGLVGLVRMRTWGVFALAGAMLASLWSAGLASTVGGLSGLGGLDVTSGLLAAVVLAMAIGPLVVPMLRHLRARR